MDSHQQFLNKLRAAPQDVSLPVFQELEAQGYDKGTWVSSPSAVDALCISLNGNDYPIAEFTQNVPYDAPVYHLTHPGCSCQVQVTGPDLPEVFVNAFGRVS